jgi:hypothetical protein
MRVASSTASSHPVSASELRLIREDKLQGHSQSSPLHTPFSASLRSPAQLSSIANPKIADHFDEDFMGECSGSDSGVSPEPRSFLLVGPGKHRFSRHVGCWCCGESGKQLTSTGQVSYHREAVASGASMCIRLILKGLSSLGGIGTGEARIQTTKISRPFPSSSQ